MEFWGTAPQWLTALIAIGALIAACASIKSQREIARKRAATDFFIKTEMDKDTLDAHKRFTAATEGMRTFIQQGGTLESFVSTGEYWDIRNYLNLHELMGVGINQEVFDDNVCYDFWSGELKRAYAATSDLVKYIQARPHEGGTYIELVKVHDRWAQRQQ